MKTTDSHNSVKVTPLQPAQAVTVYELTDPACAGDDIEILEQDIVHLGEAEFCARRVVVQLGKSVLIFHSSTHRTRSRTKLPPNMMAFMVIGESSRAKIDGLDLDCNHLLACEQGIERELVVEAGYESIAYLITADELTQHLKRRGQEQAFEMPNGAVLRHTRQSEIRDLFDIGKRLADIASTDPEIINNNIELRTAAHIDVMEHLFSTFLLAEQTEPSRIDQTSQRYSQIVKISQDYVMERHGVNYSIADMCEATATSERTLQYAFRSIMDMTPIEYLIRLRLHRARSDLLETNGKSTTVSRIAVNWGFWHLGDFSIAYKRCFGESPSQTLNRRS